jgi:four helix bundle protein
MNKEIITYRNLDAWKVAMDLVEMTYETTSKFPAKEQFGLTSQMNRSAVSIPSNIAEGHGRKGTKEFLHHLSMARGSLCELETQIILSVRLKFQAKADAEKIWQQAQEVGKLLNGLIRSLVRKS